MPSYGPARGGRIPTWVKPPKEAQRIARRALKDRAKLTKSKRGGLDATEAKEQGITSGVLRAESIAKGEWQPAEDVNAFFQRFKGTHAAAQDKPWDDSKIQQAWDLWGGDAMWQAAERVLRKENPEQARVVTQRHKKTGKKRYWVKVGDRRIGQYHLSPYDAGLARDRYNATMASKRSKAQIAKDRAAILAALEEAPMGFQSIMQALGFPEARLREAEDDRRVQSDLQALRKAGRVHARTESRFRPQDTGGQAYFGGAGMRKETYNIYSVKRESNPTPTSATDLLRRLKF